MLDSIRPRRHPALVGWSEDRATVVWESADSIDKKGNYVNVSRIELATFEDSRWSTPQIIITGTQMELDAPALARPGVAFAPTFVAARLSDSTGSVVRLARNNGGHWTTHDWRGATFLSQVAPVPMNDGSVMLLLMAALKKDDTAGVYALRGEWHNEQLTWVAPVVLEHLVGSYAAASVVRLGGDSVLVVRHKSSTGSYRDSVVTFLTTNGGRTWTRPFSGPLLTNTSDEHAVVDARGRVHLTFRATATPSVLNASGGVMHSMLTPEGWTRPKPISHEDSVTVPTVGATPDGGLLSMWSSMILSTDGAMPKSIGSYWTPGCSRP